MDAFRRMLSRAMDGGFLSGFRVDNLNNFPLEISHLMFADDILIMCDAEVDQIHNLDHILLCFKAILGLKVNLQKSEIVTVGRSCTLRSWLIFSVVVSLLFHCVIWAFL
jgi:hypothetical protein